MLLLGRDKSYTVYCQKPALNLIININRMISSVRFFMDNIFVKLGERMVQQKVGIPANWC